VVGATEGEEVLGGERFRWLAEVSQTPNALFRRVDVRVEASGGANVLSRLTGFAVQPLK
jgi:general secretion pathway protein I